MRVLDLFSGIGGFSLAAHWIGWETVAFCERDKFCKKVLNKNFPGVPIHDDVRNLEEFKQYAGAIDIICGGYPCQPFSVAGKQRGADDDRHLWPAMFDIIKAVRPRWVVAENVAGHITMGLDSVLSDLESEGYTCQPFVIPACAVNAKHRRDRVWIIAHSDSDRSNSGICSRGKRSVCSNEKWELAATYSDRSELQLELGPDGGFRFATHTDSKGPQGRQETENTEEVRQECNKQYKRLGNTSTKQRTCSSIKPGVCRSLDGIPPGLDRGVKIQDRNARIKALGNSIVPQVAYQLFKRIDQIEKFTA